MRLSHKLALSVFGIVAAYAVVDAIVARGIVYPSFEALEDRHAADDVARVAEALQRESEHLDNLCHDWAAWDDTYQFVQDHNADFVSANLSAASLENMHIALVYFTARDGTVVDECASTGAEELRDCLAAVFPRGHRDPEDVLHTIQSNTQNVRGFVALPCGVFLLSARPILPNNGEGEPIGAMIMARRLDDETLEQLHRQTRVEFALKRTDTDPAIDADHPEGTSTVEPEVHAVLDREDVLCAHTELLDYRGKPWARLEAKVPREISAEGRRAIGFAQVSMLVAALLVLAGMRFALRRLVVTPLSRVSEHAGRVGTGGDLSARLSSTRTDEIGDLSRSIDEMVGQLEESRARVVDMAHLAGRSEVAAEVLHNVGSVITSANVSTQEIEARVRRSRAADVARLAELLDAQKQDLAGFFARDPRAAQVPAFVGVLAKALEAEREALLSECGVLAQSVDHMRALVRRQQDNTGHASVAEPVELAALADLAVRLTQPGGTDPVRIERRYADLPRVPLVRHRVLEILVNLLKNARESAIASGVAEPRIEVVLRRTPDGVRVEVRDNGQGIAPENLAKIFAHGFTTKSDGHGFGLHSCANASQELGGTLHAESAGLGLGATFVLELPVEREEARAA
ncbi:MAG: HAMP domain-containing protein [Planctomycetes bacterium]|nr:HAMP domain-containing protein [Planctomycetota bacterium]